MGGGGGGGGGGARVGRQINEIFLEGLIEGDLLIVRKLIILVLGHKTLLNHQHVNPNSQMHNRYLQERYIFY